MKQSEMSKVVDGVCNKLITRWTLRSRLGKVGCEGKGLRVGWVS